MLVFLGYAMNEEDLLYPWPPVYSQFPCLEKQTPSPGRQTGWRQAAYTGVQQETGQKRITKAAFVYRASLA